MFQEHPSRESNMHTHSYAFSFVLVLAAGFPRSGKLTHTEADDFSGNGDSSYIALNDRLTTQPTIKTNTELGNDPSVTDVTQGYVEDIEDFQLTTQNYSSESYDTEMNLSSILLYAAPVLVLGLLAPLIFFIVKHRRWKKYEKEKMENEDVKGPIFEEDTPSVMEIEMEELDKWMSDMKKNAKRLSTLKEENQFRVNQKLQTEAGAL
ncbi:transmembrane protein 154 isoform X2 [Ascaphus truei]|uniref:transmembrane protein 154 isoform X2 n=2 Tax=Ascaphus truei TaxID=8439 RepID=UPI003F5AAFA7